MHHYHQFPFTTFLPYWTFRIIFVIILLLLSFLREYGVTRRNNFGGHKPKKSIYDDNDILMDVEAENYLPNKEGSLEEEAMLPHEWLRKIQQGEPILHRVVVRGEVKIEALYPDLQTRIYCGLAITEHYAPKIARTIIKESSESLEVGLKLIAETLKA